MPVTAEMQLARALGVMVQLADDVAGQVRHAQQVIELDLHDARDLVLDRQLGRHGLDHPRQELRRGAPEHGFRQALLAAEVVVQQRLVDAGLGRDVLHARARGAAPHEHGVRGVEDLLFGASRRAAGRRLPAVFRVNRFI